jgi:hypothetical protein
MGEQADNPPNPHPRRSERGLDDAVDLGGRGDAEAVRVHTDENRHRSHETVGGSPQNPQLRISNKDGRWHGEGD